MTINNFCLLNITCIILSQFLGKLYIKFDLPKNLTYEYITQ
jgi:hypothetical protein